MVNLSVGHGLRVRARRLSKYRADYERIDAGRLAGLPRRAWRARKQRSAPGAPR